MIIFILNVIFAGIGGIYLAANSTEKLSAKCAFVAAFLLMILQALALLIAGAAA